MGQDAASAGAAACPTRAARGEPGPPFFDAYGEWMGTPPPTWEDIAWLREYWGGPFMLKGVMRVDDAKRAVDAGVSAISVSNHGGNNIDGTPAPIRALPAVAEAVGDQIEVLLDGGIRRGSDVVKALALGARAVMIGRAYLWGLARRRAGRCGERARHPPRRHRLRAARPRQGLGPRLDPRGRLDAARLHPGAGCAALLRLADPGTGVTGGTAVNAMDDRNLPLRKKRVFAPNNRGRFGAHQMNSAYHRRVASRSALGHSTSGQLRDTSPTILIPLGSTEQHGPHLPLDTDTRIASAVAAAAVEELSRGSRPDANLVAPAIAYGASGEHEGFPGTVSIGTEALEAVLVEYGRSACGWAARIVFVNGHGGNLEALRAAVRLLRSEGRDAAWCPCVAENGDAHAGHTETSVLLHISPADVRTEAWCSGNQEPLVNLLPQMRHGGVAAVSEVGVLGDPTTATAADGAAIFGRMVDECRRRVDRWSPDRDGMLA